MSASSTNSSSRPPHVVIIGAGPGGLTSAMLLASRGFRVTVLEREAYVGGRNAEIRVGPYSFDLGPTFLMMKFLLDEVFAESGLSSDNFMKFVRLDPMYRLQMGDQIIESTTDHDRMRAEIGRVFPGSEKGYDLYLEREQRRFSRMLPCLQKHYSTAASMLSADLLKALPRLSLGRSLFGVLGRYFDPEKLRLAFTFQSKYLGMSPWECPAAFAILSYVEHAYGVYHVMGGLNRISQGLARAAGRLGAAIHLSTPAKRLLLDGRTVKGVELESGDRIECDDVIINADFGYAMTHLVPEGVLRKYAPARLGAMRYSCSTFMLYLGLDKVYDMPHHTIVFADDYRTNVEDIFVRQCLSRDCSIYVRNASVTDPELAPPGHSAIYVLVPVPNRFAEVNWAQERSRFRDRIIETIAQRTAMKDLGSHIRAEKVVAPDDWEETYGVYGGATFNLAHNIGQMLYFRPHNKFEELEGCYLAGGGTHPGSGIPTIIESGRISANLISRRYDVPFISYNVKV
jgi:phytoene desaturase